MRRDTIMLGVALVLGASARLQGQGFESVVQVRLATDTIIDGYPCAATGSRSAELHEDGQLASCPLAVATTIAGHDLPAGTWIQLTNAGRLWSVWLPADTRLAGQVVGELRRLRAVPAMPGIARFREGRPARAEMAGHRG